MALRVDDVILDVERERQRARLYAHARRQLARRFLGEPPVGEAAIDIDVLASVLEELLVAANGATQRAERLLAQRVSVGR
jgi:hypothetical protein